MHFADDTPNSPLLIRTYENGSIKTNAGIFSQPIVLFQDQALENVLPPQCSLLNETHFQTLVDLQPELILLGTGPLQHFLHPAILSPLHQARLGIEIMSTDAACRTFNLLLAEGRHVLAALFV